ncbi:MAG: hypothetical protein KJ667_08690, partial [Alphaproteobacteria bacterium]|nr:hypothetical protein [Alphaproteobacteria bacterium]
MPIGNLYEGYRALAYHLSLYEDEKDHPREAFAEMTAHYDMMYARFEGQEDAVDRVLTRNYPILWPAYRDMIIPKVEAHAEELWARRQSMIDSFVARSRALTDITGQPFDEGEVRDKARMYAAENTLGGHLRIVKTRLVLYDDPVGAYLEAREEWERQRWEIVTSTRDRYRQPFVFDEDKQRHAAEDFMARKGATKLLDLRDGFVASTRALERFAEREVRFAMNVGVTSAIVACFDGG